MCSRSCLEKFAIFTTRMGEKEFAIMNLERERDILQEENQELKEKLPRFENRMEFRTILENETPDPSDNESLMEKSCRNPIKIEAESTSLAPTVTKNCQLSPLQKDPNGTDLNLKKIIIHNPSKNRISEDLNVPKKKVGIVLPQQSYVKITTDSPDGNSWYEVILSTLSACIRGREQNWFEEASTIVS